MLKLVSVWEEVVPNQLIAQVFGVDTQILESRLNKVSPREVESLRQALWYLVVVLGVSTDDLSEDDLQCLRDIKIVTVFRQKLGLEC